MFPYQRANRSGCSHSFITWNIGKIPDQSFLIICVTLLTKSIIIAFLLASQNDWIQTLVLPGIGRSKSINPWAAHCNNLSHRRLQFTGQIQNVQDIQWVRKYRRQLKFCICKGSWHHFPPHPDWVPADLWHDSWRCSYLASGTRPGLPVEIFV